MFKTIPYATKIQTNLPSQINSNKYFTTTEFICN